MRCVERGVVVWFTGLPSSGKSTLASLVAARLAELGYRVQVLDGDWVRSTINFDVGFSREDRFAHLVRVAWVARLLASHGVVVLAAFVSPYRDVRAKVRSIVEEGKIPFVEVYVKVPLEVAIARDAKGLYAKALRGELKNFTGVDDPYEEPEKPDIVVDNASSPPEINAETVVKYVLALLGK